MYILILTTSESEYKALGKKLKNFKKNFKLIYIGPIDGVHIYSLQSNSCQEPQIDKIQLIYIVITRDKDIDS